MLEELAAPLDDPIPVVGGCEPWLVGDERGAQFHAGQDASDPFLAAELLIVGLDEILVPHPFGRGDALDVVVPDIVIQPRPVAKRATGQGSTVHDRGAHHVPEEVDDVLLSLEGRVVPTNHHPVQAAVGEHDIVGEKLRQLVHEAPPSAGGTWGTPS